MGDTDSVTTDTVLATTDTPVLDTTARGLLMLSPLPLLRPIPYGYYGLGYRGYGYGLGHYGYGLGYRGYYGGYYGKRSADAEPTATADAEADPYYGYYGL